MQRSEASHVAAALAGLRASAIVEAPGSLTGPTGDVISSVRLDARSNRLAWGLRGRGVLPSSRVAIACCDADAIDGLVGYVAVHKVGAEPLVVPVDPAGNIGCLDLRMPTGSDVVLACEHVDQLPRRPFRAAMVIGHGEGATWWKSLELRSSQEPLEAVEHAAELWAAEDAEEDELIGLPAWGPTADLVSSISMSRRTGLVAALGAVSAGGHVRLTLPFDPVVFQHELDAGANGLLLSAHAVELAAAELRTHTAS